MDQYQKEGLIKSVSATISALVTDMLTLDRARIANAEGRVDDDHLETLKAQVVQSKEFLEKTLEMLLL